MSTAKSPEDSVQQRSEPMTGSRPAEPSHTMKPTGGVKMGHGGRAEKASSRGVTLETVDLHSLPQRAERPERLTCGELEPPCYGSVWPVVWGAGVKIPGLPD